MPLSCPISFAVVAGASIRLREMIATCFGIEVFISEVYDGPGKSLLVFLPTVILTTVMPLLSGMLTTAATRLTDYENYGTESQYERAFTSKIFILNFITSLGNTAMDEFGGQVEKEENAWLHELFTALRDDARAAVPAP